MNVDKLKNLTPEQIALIRQKMLAKKRQAAQPKSTWKQVSRELPHHPLSFAQESLWFLHQVDPNRLDYNLFTSMYMGEDYQPELVTKALLAMTRRHEGLRTTFTIADGHPVQVIGEAQPVVLELRDFSQFPAAEQGKQIAAWIEREMTEPFDLEQGPLIRYRPVKLNQTEYYFYCYYHHIISDLWSMEIFTRELGECYLAQLEHRPLQLPRLPFQYVDYAVWQRQQPMEELAEYWRKQLGQRPEYLELPTDFPRPTVPNVLGGRCTWKLAGATVHGLKQLARQEGATLPMAVLAALTVLMQRYSGQDKILLGATASNREQKETNGILGFFVNVLVYATDLSACKSFRDVLAAVKQTFLDAMKHGALPFAKLTDVLGLERDLHHNPFTRVMFNFMPALGESEDAEDEDGEDSFDYLTSQYELAFMIHEEGEGIYLDAEFQTAIFTAATVRRMLSHLQCIAEAMVADGEAAFAEVALMDEAEQQRLLVTLNETARDYQSSGLLLTPFLEQVALMPQSTALIWEEDERELSLSYLDFAQQVFALTAQLKEYGVQAGDQVGVMMTRSPEMVMALHGIVLAGAAYLPLDPELPQARLDLMIEDAGCNLVVVRKAVTLGVDHLVVNRRLQPLKKVPALNVFPESPAYTIFTSGTTGRPKGVSVSHGAIDNRLHWMQETYPLIKDDRVLQKTPFGFDVSVWEFFWPLRVGATLVIAEPGGHKDPAYLAGVIERQGINLLHFVPSMLRVFLEQSGDLTSLRQVIASGEALPTEAADQFARRLPFAHLDNLYGPTEAAVDVTFWPSASGLKTATVPIGKPIANISIYLLDERLEPVPVGIPGQLYIGGVGLALGYLNRPGLTATRFIPWENGERLYATGDLARYDVEGVITFLGRMDFQVKLRGFRIELGEIEAVLAQMDGIEEAAVRIVDEHIIAYYVGEPQKDPKAELAEKLPAYMVPAQFMALTAMPRTNSGKLDRAALPEPAPAELTSYEAPRTTNEQVLAAIWQEFLEVAAVGRGDDFFALGGHSLTAGMVVARLKERLGVEMSLASFFANPTLAAMARVLDDARDQRLELPGPRACEACGPAPLSSTQRRLWLIHKLEPVSARYNMPEAVLFEDGLVPEILELALADLQDRHDALRTKFTEILGEPRQVVSEAIAPLRVVDLGNHVAEAERLAACDALLSFDLEGGPLFRVTLVRLGEQGDMLLVNMHHIISDGWSLKIFNRDLAALYTAHLTNQKTVLPELPIRYSDFARWQKEFLTSETMARQLDFWKSYLGEPPVLELPLDHPRPEFTSYEGRMLPFQLNEELVVQLQQLSRANGVTLFMTMLSAFAVLLQRYSSQNDLVVGVPIANRNRVETEHMIGFFVNVLPLRLDLEANPSFTAMLERVRQTSLAAYDNQDVPFEMLVDHLQVERDLSRNPVFQVVFNHEMGVDGEGEGDQEERPAIAKFDLTMHVRETPTGIHGGLEYNGDLFEAATARRFLDHFQRICSSVGERPEVAINQALIANQVERQRILNEWNTTDRVFVQIETLHGRFEQRVRLTPDNIALVWREEMEQTPQSFTYAALNLAANRMAHGLIERGVRQGDLVAMDMPRGAELVIALLATQKAGAAYTYLDPAYPQQRRDLILEDAAPTQVIRDLSWSSERDDNPVTVADVNRPSYVIYTSGTTGRPKGCSVSHKHVGRLFDATYDWFHFSANDTWTLFHSLAFDFSVWELWGALLYGGRLVVVPYEISRSPRDFRQLLVEERVTVLNQTPTAFAALAAEDARATLGKLGLRYVIFGGEALDLPSLAPWFARHGEIYPRLVNMYGITETCVHVTYRSLRAEDAVAGKGSMIGRPIPDLQLYICNEAGQLVPPGVPGQIYVAGAGVTNGYLNRPELTQERFIEGGFPELPVDGSLYATGDRARFTAEGEVEYLGRVDDQVKLRGFRIELGDISAQLSSHEAVSACAVMIHNEQLAAYYCSEEKLAAQDLRAYLATRLPDYMVPASYTWLEQLPLTVHGKLDKAALPSPTPIADEEHYAEPKDQIEYELTRIWEQVLDTRPIGARDNFFEIGGNSLLGVALMNEIESHFGRRLPLALLFREGTPVQLANVLRGEITDLELDALVPIQPKGKRQPMFWIHPIGGNVFAYIQLAWTLGEDQPFFGLQAPSLSGTREHFGSNEAAAAHYIERIRSVQPQGPYQICGWSSGGVLAYEICRQLHEAGETVNRLLLLDTCAPQAHLPMEDWEIAVSFLVDYYRGSMKLDGRKFKKRSFDESLDWVANKAAARGLNVNTNREQLRHLHEIFQRDMRSFEAYKIQPFGQKITLLRAKDSEEGRLDPTLGWAAFLDEKDLEIHEVDGDHFSVLKPPHLDGLCKTIQDKDKEMVHAV